MRPWKGTLFVWVDGAVAVRNGATALRPWKGGWEALPSFWELPQWGHGLEAVERMCRR